MYTQHINDKLITFLAQQTAPYQMAKKEGSRAEDLLSLLVDMMESDSGREEMLQSAVKLEECGGVSIA